jgi:hypothetical protein
MATTRDDTRRRCRRENHSEAGPDDLDIPVADQLR